MRKFLVIFVLLTFAFGSDELKRPSSDADSATPAWALANCGIGNYVLSGSGALARDAAGQTTSVSYSAFGDATDNYLAARVWSTWAAAGQTYTALSLNVNSSSAGLTGDGGMACLVYSTNSGSSYTAIRCDSAAWGNTTDMITLSASQNLSTLRVGMCVWGSANLGGGDGSDTITISDIWTDGTYTPTSTSSTTTPTAQRHRGLFF